MEENEGYQHVASGAQLHRTFSLVRRLLAERPEATGLAVPGMPMGSPGMETRFEPDVYDVMLFDSVRASHYATYHVGEKVEQED